MKNFLTYTAIIEAITGLGLMIIPSTVARILLNSELEGPVATLLAMVGGAAIFSLALGAWFNRSNIQVLMGVRMLLFYNAIVTLIFLFGSLKMGLGGLVLWSVIVFHFAQTVICLNLLRDRKVI
jgi:xanthine/uracil permease